MYIYIYIDIQISNIISWFFAVLFAFITNKKYVFESKKKGKENLAEMIKFYLSRISTLLIDMGVMWLLTAPLNINDKISMTDYYKSEGSGSLQFKGVNAVYSIDDLARVMITESDNSATNMLLAATGGMNAMNSSLRKWGMKETQ